MTLSDEVFDVLLILLYLATPLVWAATVYFQDSTRSSLSNHPQTGWSNPSTASFTTHQPGDKL